jgi:hypothetical protein
MIINYTNINKTYNHLSPKGSLNSDGHQLHWHKQNEQSPHSLKKVYTGKVINYTNINNTNNHLSPKGN